MANGTLTRRANKNWLATTMLYSGAVLWLMGAAGAANAGGLPAGGTVAAGTATISSNGQTTTVNQSSSRAVINWDSFSVAKDKAVDFVQPGANAATLNRVTGNTTSTIAGQIHSNGAVYLINPNGIAITASGTVQTGGGFVASTLDMADADFMGGKLHFTGGGNSAKVSNAGSITAGQGAYVALLGGSVANSGKIAVPMGRVSLGSGEDITLDLNGDGFMQVAVPTKTLSEGALIEHSGTISAGGGLIVLSAASVKDAVRNVINLSGGISADSATGSGGHIVLFGGDGGTVTAGGILTARATGASGNGGVVETSGAKVDFTGLNVDTSAAHGATGTWLVDPTDLTVDSAAAGTISSNLATSNVTLQTNADGTTSGPGNTSSGNGDITVNSGITWNSTNALTLSAYHDININAPVVASSSASIVLRADNNGIGTGSLYFGELGTLSVYSTRLYDPYIFIYYNPSGYSTPTDFSQHIINRKYLAYMLVDNVVDLQNMNQNLTGDYAVGRDIDASATATWNGGAGFVPIGTDGAGNILGSDNRGFSGHFDGNSYTVSNLTINRPNSDYVGLFGVVSVSDGGRGNSIQDFQNINLINASIAGQSYVGGIFGRLSGDENVRNINFSGSVAGSSSAGSYAGGVAGNISSYFSQLDGMSSSGSVSGRYSVGGLVGGMSGSNISNSQSESNVTGDTYVGGLMGSSSAFGVSSVYATGTVTGNTAVGGLIGSFYGMLSRAYSTGKVSVTTGVNGMYIGGLIGRTDNYPIDNVYSTSDVNAPNSQYVGGLFGYDYQSDLTNAYYAGHISASGSTAVGALIGSRGGYNTNVTSALWDSSTVGSNALTAFGEDTAMYANFTGAGAGTAQLQDFNSYRTTYANWDFSFTWSPPTQVGQAGQSQAYYPQLYAVTPVVVATAESTSRAYGAANPTFSIGINFGGHYDVSLGGYPVIGYVFGPTTTLPGGDSLSNQSLASAGLTSALPVGQYAILNNSATSARGVTYRVIDTTGGQLTINPAAVTVTYTADPVSRPYATNNPGFTGTQSATGLVNGDTLAGAMSGTASYGSTATTASNAGSYAVTGTGLSGNNSNYSFTFVQAAGNATALSVTPVAATITYTANPFSRAYGSINPSFTGTESVTGLVNGDTLATATTGTATYSSTANARSNVGSYAITGSGLSSNGNYTFTFVQATSNATALTVMPAALTVTYTTNPFSRIYGSANPGFTGTQTATGLVNGDTVASVTTGAANYSTTATSASNVGSYAVTGGGLSANSSNYTFIFAQAADNATALSVTPAALSVVANPLSRTYGSANPTLTYNSTGLVNGDTLSGSLATAATTGSNVGTYAITQGTLAASSNYALTFTGELLTVNPAPLTVTYTANPFSRTYGSANPTFTGTQTSTGLVNGDTLAGVTTGTASYSSMATASSNVGSYAVNGSGLSANSGNYSFTFAQAASNATALSVTPAALTITYTADPISRVYGAVNPSFTGSQTTTGLVNGDTLAGVTTGTASYSSTANTNSNVGSYAVTGSGLSANSGNYAFTFRQDTGNATTLSVTPRPVDVTADPLSRLFGLSNPPLTYAIAPATGTSGLVNGDGLTGALTTSATPESSAGSYQIEQGSLAATSNYTLNYTGAVLTIIQPNQLSDTVTKPSTPTVASVSPPAPVQANTQFSENLRNDGKVVLFDTCGGTSCQ